jgi:D-cysteine desulfhydrase
MTVQPTTSYIERIDALAPPRLALAHLPTPLQPMERLGRELGVALWVKRDDYTGAELSGNKIRKLEYVLAEARAQGADTVLTCGGVQSNHCRATALAAAGLGLDCTLLLRTADPGAPPLLAANSLLDRMAGARIVWVSPEEYRNREDVFAREAEDLKKAGRRPFIIPEGASDALGAWTKPNRNPPPWSTPPVRGAPARGSYWASLFSAWTCGW